MNDLQALFLRGMKPYFPGSDAEILHEVARAIQHEKVFVSDKDGHPVAFCILLMPRVPTQHPQVYHFYSEGGREITTALVGRVLDFVRKSGYNKLQAINGSGIPDEVWTRLFRHDGWEIKPVKTVFEFEVVK